MSLAADVKTPSRVASKSEFARLIGVSPGRITQFIADGTIGADALEGEGRSARIKVEVARRQVRTRRDLGQAMGNGARTRVLGTPSASSSFSGPQDSDTLDDVEIEYKREKLRSAQINNRKLAEEEEARRGRFMEAVQARAEMARIASAVLQACEGSLPNLASAIAAQFEIPQRDVLHTLQTEFRKVRQATSDRHAAAAKSIPSEVEAIVVQEGSQ